MLDDSEYMLHLYSLFLLSKFREKQAFNKIIKLVSMDEEDVEEMFGDLVTENLSSILYSTYDGGLEFIQGLIENTKAHFYVRSVTLDLYIKLYNDNEIKKDDVINYLKKLMYEVPFNEDNDLASDIVVAVRDAHLFELIGDVEYLYSEFRVDESYIGRFDSFIDMIYNYDYEESNVHFIDDLVGEMEWWDCFEDNKNNKEKDYSIEELIEKLQDEYEQKIKIGRNDPCPCGSGKKYKKCCINKTEDDFEIKDKIWLKDYPVEPEVKVEGRVYLSDHFDKESIEIDKLVYLALHRRAIPKFVKRDIKAEEKNKINYLIRAYKIFIDKCKRENITSFDDYDKKYKIHYYSQLWFEELRNLMSKQPNKEMYENYLCEVKEIIRSYGI